MADRLHPKPGDLLEYRCPTFGIMWQWRVLGVYLGANALDSFIEVETVHGGRPPFRIPEPLTRAVTIYRPENQTNG